MSGVIEFVIRSSAVIACGLLISASLRRQPAALRHLVVAVALVLGTCVPVLQWATPAWTVVTPRTVVTIETSAAAVSDVERATAPTSPDAGSAPPTGASASVSGVLTAIWIAGALASALALGFKLRGLRRLGQTATPVSSSAWTAAAAEIARACGVRRTVALLEIDQPDMLATWGVRRPRILLPTHARNWDERRVRAVLVHEIAHIRRGDWAVQLLAETIRAVYWFNPVVWLACRELHRQSEGACDAAVVRTGMPPHEYAAHLLEIARSCRAHAFPVAAAVPMARPSTLQSRVAAMLSPRFVKHGLAAPAVALVLVALAGIALPAAALRLAQAGPAPLSGVVYDPTGAVMPSVELSLQDERQNSWTATTDAAGKFEFGAVQPGRYKLQAKLPGFRALEQTLTLAAPGDWTRAVTLQVGTLTETITVQEQRRKTPRKPSDSAPAPVRVGGNIKPPMKLRDVKPVYPEAMRDAGIQGTVPLEALIGVDGSVASVRVISAQVHPDLAQAAINAVRQWKFSPTLLNGREVEVVMNVSISFQLAD